MPKSRKRPNAVEKERANRRRMHADNAAERAAGFAPLTYEINDAFLDGDAHRALLERGWDPGENREAFGDLWEWGPSIPEGVDTAGTCIHPTGDGGFRVELVSEWPAPITEVTYPGLTELLDDIEVLEDLRAGDPAPTLPHATDHQTRPRRRFEPDTWT